MAEIRFFSPIFALFRWFYVTLCFQNKKTPTNMNLKHLKNLVGIALVAVSTAANAGNFKFEDKLIDRTLRVDYIFSGDCNKQSISLDELCSIAGWAGRRENLDSVPMKGYGNITMTDKATGLVIYKTSFSTLFQEWLGTEEATRTTKAFENVFLLPMPKERALIHVELYDFKGGIQAEMTHEVDPHDILIKPIDPKRLPEHRYIVKSPRRDAIDIAIVAEGYTPGEMGEFYKHAETAAKALFSHEPFKKYADCFNVVAVGLPSVDSGVSIPGKREWKNTALSSHFDTFYSARYLTTLRLRQMHNALAGIPYEHIIILANTTNYGGGGILNLYTLTTARHANFEPVVVHEFGHSFAGLADEYYYDDEYTKMFSPEAEPWEQNITTLKDLNAKWADMLPKNTEIPTPPNPKHMDRIGVYEGAGYQSKGVYRAFQDCRMKTNEAPEFCAVCQRALTRLIQFYVPDAQR